jgi:hypothetical protein
MTLKFNGLSNMVSLDIEITSPDDRNKVFKTKGIFDTGATASVITQEAANFLGLKQTGVASVNTASHTGMETSTYRIDLFLKSDLRVRGVDVTVGKIIAEHGFDCLIGMDIITLGDFSITNHQGNTCMSLRIPSAHEIDYVKNPRLKINISAPTGGSNYTPPKKKRKK